MTQPKHIPLVRLTPRTSPEKAAQRFYEAMRVRRSVRFFSDAPVSEETIRACIAAAGTAPSGANKQPWRFVAIANPELKKQIRDAAETEERAFYERRATPEWLADLATLGTDSSKPFIETAPWLIVVFKLMMADPVPFEAQPGQGLLNKVDPNKDDPAKGETAEGETAEGEQRETNRLVTQGKVYYVEESVGIAVGMLISAIHHAGLVTLTHTPSPMGFLAKVLKRPAYERAYLLLPVGYPASDCTVPDIERKPLEQIMVVHR